MKKPKAYFNVLKLRLNMTLKREVVTNYPVAAFMEPNLFCNLHCPACPTGLNLRLRPTVSVEEEFFRSAIDEIGDYLFQLYMYNWGEPLLHKRTPEMIAYAKAKDIRINLSTNLSIKLTDDYIERLVRSGLDTMLVSLDGVTAETYSRYRRNGNFELVRENMRRIRETKDRLGLKTPKVVWQFLVFRHNEHEIEQARALHREWGADEMIIAGAEMPMEPHSEGFEPSTIPEYNIYHPDHPTQREAQRLLASDRACGWLYGVMVLNPNGKVSPCCAVPTEKLDFGEYQKGGKLLDVWNNDKFRRARRLFAPAGKRAPKRLTDAEKQEISQRITGMSMKAALSVNEETQLICHKCPIPSMQNYTGPIITEVINQLNASSAREKSQLKKLPYLLRYWLMGAPEWNGLARPRAAVFRYLSRAARR